MSGNYITYCFTFTFELFTSMAQKSFITQARLEY